MPSSFLDLPSSDVRVFEMLEEIQDKMGLSRYSRAGVL